MNQRHSKAAEADLVKNPKLKAEAEARNGLKQYDYALEFIKEKLERGAFKLRPSLVLSLHRQALDGLSIYAGNYRPSGVKISGSKHEPVDAFLVAELLEEMCDYVNDNWDTKTAIHLSSYVMWRLNWIHPFADGNGKTSRMLSYIVLCIHSECIFSGLPTIPEQIVANRQPYFHALDDADLQWKEEVVDVTSMENLLSGMLAQQLKNAYDKAVGDI